MTGELVKAMRRCPQPIVAAVDGVCAGAGAILAMASDLLGTRAQQTAFLFQPRASPAATWARATSCRASSAQGRASEPAVPGRAMGGEGAGLGLLPACATRRTVLADARAGAELARRPTFANGITKTCCTRNGAMGMDQTIEAGGPGAGAVHADRGLLARVPRLRRQSRFQGN